MSPFAAGVSGPGRDAARPRPEDEVVTLVSSSAQWVVDLQQVGVDAVRVPPENLERVLSQPGRVVVDVLARGAWSPRARRAVSRRVADVVLLLDNRIAATTIPDEDGGPGLRVVRTPVHARDVAAALASLGAAADPAGGQGTDGPAGPTSTGDAEGADVTTDEAVAATTTQETAGDTGQPPRGVRRPVGVTRHPHPPRRPPMGRRVVAGAFLTADTVPGSASSPAGDESQPLAADDDDWAASALRSDPAPTAAPEDAPAADAPAAGAPAAVEPLVDSSVVVEPVVDEPVVAEPVVAEPVVAEPVVAEPVVAEPVVDEPVVDEPVVDEPVVDEPVLDEPVVSEPVADEPVVAEAVAAEPVAAEPVAAEPVVSEPVADEPVVAEPVAAEPVAHEPVVDRVATRSAVAPPAEVEVPEDAPAAPAAPTPKPSRGTSLFARASSALLRPGTLLAGGSPVAAAAPPAPSIDLAKGRPAASNAEPVPVEPVAPPIGAGRTGTWRPTWEEAATALLDHLEGAETWLDVAQRVVEDVAAWTQTHTALLVREPDGTWYPVAGVGLRSVEFGLKLPDTHLAVRLGTRQAPVVVVEDTDALRSAIANMPLASRRSLLVGRVPGVDALLVAGTSQRPLGPEDVKRVGVVLGHFSAPLREALERRAVADVMQRFL